MRNLRWHFPKKKHPGVGGKGDGCMILCACDATQTSTE